MVVKAKYPLVKPEQIQEILAKTIAKAPVELQKVPVKLPPPRKKVWVVLTVEPPNDAEVEAAELAKRNFCLWIQPNTHRTAFPRGSEWSSG